MGTPGNSGRGSTAATSRPKVSAKVYRRRRLVAGILALLIVGALIAGGFFLAGLFTSNPAAEPAAGVAPTATGAPEEAPPAAKPGTPPSAVCDEGGIKVVAAVDKSSYGPGETPILSLKVTNSGKAPCDINVGTSQMQYEITSGNDVIFNSKNCQIDPGDLVKNLAPGASETANLVWKVNRNAPGCAEVLTTPGRGGATYGLVATLGKWSSDKVTFTLL